jgi:hypothetical protein
LVNQYLQQTKLDSVLLLAIRHILSGDLLPKNPYYKLSRFLNASNIQKEVVVTYERSQKNFRKNLFQLDDKPYGIVTLGNNNNLSGLSILLEWVDSTRFEKLFSAIEHALPDYSRKYPNCQVEYYYQYNEENKYTSI